MRPTHIAAFTLLIVFLAEGGCAVRYVANWTSLDARPLPQWYDDAKIGIFVHWGVFSVPAFGKFSEWLWYYWHYTAQAQVIEFIKNNYPPGWKYADFAPQFHAEFFDPDAWAELFKASGAGYDPLTQSTLQNIACLLPGCGSRSSPLKVLIHDAHLGRTFPQTFNTRPRDPFCHCFVIVSTTNGNEMCYTSFAS